MMRVKFSIAAMSAWAPNIETDEAWQNWAQEPQFMPNYDADGKVYAPRLAAIPAMQRRRFSFNSKMAIHCALETLAKANFQQGDYLPNVFASADGEVGKTLSLFESLGLQEPLSPMGFSLSVHNTAAGLFSIHTKNHAPSSSISAQQETLFAGFVEALLMSADQQQAVLYVYSAEHVPMFFQDIAACDGQSHALACLVAAEGVALGDALPLCLERIDDDQAAADAPILAENGLRLLQFYYTQAEGCVIEGENRAYRLSRTSM